MKKAQRKIRNLVLIFSMCLFLFNFCGCGIDNITVIDDPVNTRHTPQYTTTDYAEKYFEFLTNEVNAESYGDCKFLGTEVYYKIYTDISTMSNERSTLITVAHSDTSSATATTKMIDGYGYKALKVTNQNQNTLIPSTGTDKIVYIRLTDYQDTGTYSARILIGGSNGTNLTGTDKVNVPIRNNNDDYLSFNFGRSSVNSSFNKIPVNGDLDVKYTSSASDGKWYVVLFAVGVARDVTHSPVYSNILYLGEVTIDSNSFDN